jgi:hypothetical protein
MAQSAKGRSSRWLVSIQEKGALDMQRPFLSNEREGLGFRSASRPRRAVIPLDSITSYMPDYVPIHSMDISATIDF